MFYEKELTINGTKYIRADRAVDYVREIEDKIGKNLTESPMSDRYRMTQNEFYEVCDLFDKEVGDRNFIEIEGATVHVLTKGQLSMVNKVLDGYYDIVYARLENAVDEIEGRN